MVKPFRLVAVEKVQQFRTLVPCLACAGWCPGAEHLSICPVLDKAPERGQAARVFQALPTILSRYVRRGVVVSVRMLDTRLWQIACQVGSRPQETFTGSDPDFLLLALRDYLARTDAGA